MGVTNYVWDVVNDTYLMETDETGDTTAEYTNEPGQYGPLLSQRRESVTGTYHFDGRHSTQRLTDEGGNVTHTASYTVFGKTISSSGTTKIPFGYTGALGYYINPSTEDLYVRNRIYSQSTGRWLSYDPLGFADSPRPNGNVFESCSSHATGYGFHDPRGGAAMVPNLYRYALNQPVDYADPPGNISATQSNLTKLRCGGFRVTIRFMLDFEYFRTDLTFRDVVPLAGYFVQHIRIWSQIKKCPGTYEVGCCKVPWQEEYDDFLQERNPTKEFWEAVAISADRNAVFPDVSSAPPQFLRWGHRRTFGEVRFYPRDRVGHVPGTGNLNMIWPNNVPEAGLANSTEQRPDFWNHRPLEGPKWRLTGSDWCCCGADQITEPFVLVDAPLIETARTSAE